MLKRYAVFLVIAFILGFGYIIYARSLLRWTGFYYPGGIGTIGIMDHKSIMQPKYQSDLNEFGSLKECQNWAKMVHKIKNVDGNKDMFFCAMKCQKMQSAEISCLSRSGVLATFE